MYLLQFLLCLSFLMLALECLIGGRMYLCVCGGHVECKEKKVFSVGQKEWNTFQIIVQYCFTGTLIAEKQKANGRKFTNVSRLSTYTYVNIYIYIHTHTNIKECLFSNRCRTGDLQLEVIFAVWLVVDPSNCSLCILELAFKQLFGWASILCARRR